jgi:hypothetical protein
VKRSTKYFTCEFIATEYAGTFTMRSRVDCRREDSANVVRPGVEVVGNPYRWVIL